MLAIIRHIEYLLRRNDCVVLPNFGAFIVHKENAVLTEAGTIIPPVKQIAFNGAITHNDGMLATSLMRKNQISYDKAISIIAEEVSALKAQLSEFGEMDFGNLGRFKEADSVITFEPSALNNFFGDYYGLTLLNLTKPMQEEQSVDAVEHNAEKSKRNDIIYIPINKNIFRVVATVAILIVLSFVLSTPIVVENTPDTAAIVPTVNISKSNIDPVVNEVEKKETIEEKTVEETVEPEGQKKYHLIVASFRTERQAKKFIEESSLENLVMMEKYGNFYKVSSVSSDSFDDVEKEREKLLANNIDSWIFRAE